jgi:hypothetical protein
MAARFAFLALLVRRHGPLDDDTERALGPPDYSFMDEQTRRLWTDLRGGDRITKPKPTWKAYHDHVEFRNLIAHGAVWGDSEARRVARRSVLAAHGLLLRMDETMLSLDAEPD